MKIEVELDAFEHEKLASLIHDDIVEHRQEAKFKHAVGDMTKNELDWHFSHAEWTEEIAVKIFPNWNKD